MKYIIALSVFFLSCGVTQQASCPPTPSPVVCPPPSTKVDTFYTPVFIFKDSPVTLNVTVDTGRPPALYLHISPTGDNADQLQAAVDYGNSGIGPVWITLADVGAYHISRPIVCAVLNSTGTNFLQSQIHIRGPAVARNAIGAAYIVADYGDAPALALQNCKGFDILDLGFSGQYKFPNTMSILTQDTLTDKGWQVGNCSFGRTNPHTAIAIDPFSDPKFFHDTLQMYAKLLNRYIPGMNDGGLNSGSTAGRISGCQIQNFVVGIMISPAMQANAEDIYVDDNCIQYCKSAYAYSQAQSKNNTLTKLQDWGFTRTVLDGVNYGFPRLDGATPPKCADWNIAGSVYQLVEAYTMAYTLTMRDITAEEVFKIGMVYGTMGTLFEGWTVDFQQAGAAIPSPDWYILGNNITWQNCELRHFNGNTPPMRLTFVNPGDVFRDCTFGNEPITKIVGAAVNNVKLDHNYLYYKLGALMADSGAADSWAQLSVTDTLHMNRADFTGYLLEGKTLKVGDNLATNIDLPMGLVTAISGDTAFVSHIGVGAYDKHVYNLFYNRLKQ